MNTISINHAPNTMGEIRMLSNVSWKEIVTMLVRTDEEFLYGVWRELEPAKQNHAVKLTLSKTDSGRYLMTMEFVWREGEKYHRSARTQEFFSFSNLPDHVWQDLEGAKGEYSVLVHASEIMEYKNRILNFKDSKVQICDGDDSLMDLVRSHLKEMHADSGTYTVEIVPQKLLNKVVVYYDAMNRYECLTFYTANVLDLTPEQDASLAAGKTVAINVVYKKSLF